jgi:hypothetical protein
MRRARLAASSCAIVVVVDADEDDDAGADVELLACSFSSMLTSTNNSVRSTSHDNTASQADSSVPYDDDDDDEQIQNNGERWIKKTTTCGGQRWECYELELLETRAGSRDCLAHSTLATTLLAKASISAFFVTRHNKNRCSRVKESKSSHLHQCRCDRPNRTGGRRRALGWRLQPTSPCRHATKSSPV